MSTAAAQQLALFTIEPVTEPVPDACSICAIEDAAPPSLFCANCERRLRRAYRGERRAA